MEQTCSLRHLSCPRFLWWIYILLEPNSGKNLIYYGVSTVWTGVKLDNKWCICIKV